MEYANAGGKLASLGIPKYNFGYIEVFSGNSNSASHLAM